MSHIRTRDARRFGIGSAVTTTIWGRWPFLLRIKLRASVRLFCARSLRMVYYHTVNQVDKISGQTLGKQFELLTMQFLQETFPQLQNLRPGRWTILQLGNNNKLKTSDFAQYEHLAYLSELTAQNAQLADRTHQFIQRKVVHAVDVPCTKRQRCKTVRHRLRSYYTKKKIAIFIHGCYWHGHDCGSRYAHSSQSNKAYWGPKIQRTQQRDQEHIAKYDHGWISRINCSNK